MNKTLHMSAAEYRDLMHPERNVDPDVRYRNHCSSDRGHAFENLIMKGCQYYAQKGQAQISKVYEPYRCIKKMQNGRFVGQFVGRAEPDFKGVLCGGTAIAFEAKSTNKSRIQKSALTDPQTQWLEAQRAMGALAFVCVDISGRFFMIPWLIWRDMRSIYGKKFLMPDDIPEYEVIYDGSVRFLEYENGRTIKAEGVINHG